MTYTEEVQNPKGEWFECEACEGSGEVQDFRDWSLGGLIEMYMSCGECQGRGGWFEQPAPTEPSE